jgi:sulfoxide reductase heme-binding subunit YedZ
LARIEGVRPGEAGDDYVDRVLAAQAKRWGGPLHKAGGRERGVTRRGRIGLKVLVWAGCLAPAAALAWRLLTDPLVTNPIDVATDTLGEWTLRLLLLSLTMTPLRIVFGLSWPVTLRRLLGLFAFAYACLHFSVWLVLDHFFDWPEMAADVVKRPYITVGVTALLLLVPLAATSTTGMIRRLGPVAWRRLHRLAYVAGVLGVLHYLWLAKVGVQGPYYYALWLGVVLGVRLVDAVRRARVRARRRGDPRAALAPGPARPA